MKNLKYILKEKQILKSIYVENKLINLDVINEYGADTFRLYELFMGDFEKAALWSTSSMMEF